MPKKAKKAKAAAAAPTMPKKAKAAAAPQVTLVMGHSRLYLNCAIEEDQIIGKLITWDKIVACTPKPKAGEHYTSEPWGICYKGGRLSPTAGKWFLIGVSDSEAGCGREGIRHFYVHQEDSVKDLPGIDDLQDECDEIVQ